MDQGFYPSRLTSGPKRWFSQNILVRARCQFCDDIVVKYWRHSYFMWRLQTLSHRGLPSPAERRSRHVGDVKCSFEQVANLGRFDSKDPLNWLPRSIKLFVTSSQFHVESIVSMYHLSTLNFEYCHTWLTCLERRSQMLLIFVMTDVLINHKIFHGETSHNYLKN